MKAKMIYNIILLCLFSGKTCSLFAFCYLYVFIYRYIDLQKYIQIFILLITVHNKAILTVTVIQVQNFGSSSKHTLFVWISHTNKALILPRILVWGEREVLGHLSETSRCPGAPTEQQFGAAFQSSQSEQGSALCCLKAQSPPPGHSRSIFAHTAHLDISGDRGNLLVPRAFLGLTDVYLTFKWNCCHISRLCLNYKE